MSGLQTPGFLVLCVGLAFAAAASFTALAQHLAAGRGPHRWARAMAGAALIGLLLAGLDLVFRGTRVATLAPQPADWAALMAPGVAAMGAAAAALLLWRAGRPWLRIAAACLLTAGAMAGAVGQLAGAQQLPSLGSSMVATIALAAATVLALSAAGALMAPESGSMSLRGGGTAGLLTAALLAAHALVPFPDAAAAGARPWSFPASIGLDAALAVTLLVLSGALATALLMAWRRARSTGAAATPIPSAEDPLDVPAVPAPAAPLPAPLAPTMGTTQRFLVRLRQMTEELRRCQRDSDAWRTVSLAGPELFSRWDGVVSFAGAEGGVSVVASWGRLDAARRDRCVDDLARRLPQQPAAVEVLDELDERDAAAPAIRTRIVWSPSRVGTLHLVARQPVSEKELRNAAWAAEAFGETLQMAMSELQSRQSERTHDPLGSLADRRFFADALQRECRRADRGGGTLVLALLEVDPMQELQPLLGGRAGDELVRLVAPRLLTMVRPYDLVCRVGDARLAVLIADLPLKIARSRLERLRAQLAGIQASCDGQALPPPTLSIGLADNTQGSADDLLHRAEVALRVAERGGRDRLICWDRWSDPRSYLGAWATAPAAERAAPDLRRS